MKIATWNVNGIRAREQQVLEFLQEERPDILCLQEIKAGPEKVPQPLREVEGYWSCWHGAKGYSGVALLIAKELCGKPPVFFHPSFDAETRIVAAMVCDITVASVYVPNGGKDFEAKMRFLLALEEYAKELVATEDALVVCGDLNVAHAEIDVHPKERRPVIGQSPVERTQFTRLLESGLVDLGRMLDPANEGLFTWWAPWRQMRQRNIGWRLDYVLSTSALAKRVSACTVRADFGTSDHAPVVATFTPSSPAP
jgi:exodeoxyribonuclease-3